MKSVPRAILPCVLALLLGGTAAARAEDDPPWAGKKKTDRSIHLSVTVDASAAEVFQWFTTREGVSSFFAPGANIDPKVGGRYEILFDPAGDPQGVARGCGGCRVLRFEPGKSLAFEWSFPPFGFSEKPLPTWIELTFTPVDGAPGKTVVDFTQYGFPPDPKWDHVYQLFSSKNWPLILSRLQDYARDRKPFDWSSWH